ncbi:hypothetical protein TNCV_2086341 [Trichonephila clavipes]|nr:hypothetical protein TNCV_2086341 [Trichonephila clavipes]
MHFQWNPPFMNIAGNGVVDVLVKHSPAHPSDFLTLLTYAEMDFTYRKKDHLSLFLLFNDIKVNVLVVPCYFDVAGKNKLLLPISIIDSKFYGGLINLDLVILDPNSSRAIELWTFHPRSANFNPHCPVHWKHFRYPLPPSVELPRVLVF